ncbi:MAG: hypothetical protein V1891_01500 [bacterium]
MFWFTKNKYKNSLEANNLIHDALAMGVCDKYIKKDNLENDEYGLLLLARSLNWLIPRQDYNFDNDMEKIGNENFKNRLKEDEDKIFIKGLEIVNSDSVLEKLINHYVAYHIYLLNTLFPKNTEEKFPGIIRMRKILFQTTENEPDIKSPEFKENYKELFVKFNEEYGKYGKVLKEDTITALFSQIH